MRRLIIILIMASIIGCQKKSRILHHNKDFSVYSDKVVQGEFTAQVLTDGSMTSTYKSIANEARKRIIELKIARILKLIKL